MKNSTCANIFIYWYRTLLQSCKKYFVRIFCLINQNCLLLIGSSWELFLAWVDIHHVVNFPAMTLSQNVSIIK